MQAFRAECTSLVVGGAGQTFDLMASSGEEPTPSAAWSGRKSSQQGSARKAPQSGPHAPRTPPYENLIHPDRCHLCLGYVPVAEATRFKGASFHGQCWNAVRSNRHQARERKHERDGLMLFNAVLWRSQVLPLVRKDGEPRDTTARIAASPHSTNLDVVTYTEEQRIVDTILMTKLEYKLYRKQRFDEVSEAASEGFDELQDSQRGAYNTESDNLVAVEGQVKIRLITGKRTRNIGAAPPVAAGGQPAALEERSRRSSVCRSISCGSVSLWGHLVRAMWA